MRRKLLGVLLAGALVALGAWWVHRNDGADSASDNEALWCIVLLLDNDSHPSRARLPILTT